ncbi:MAG: VCBS repeat-containing protein [Methanomicrobia archaeon]|nr:VCBS repeat-containing protein [Methanomicrobia archaeon]
MRSNYPVTGLCVCLLLITIMAVVSAGSDIQIEGAYRELWNQSESEIERVEVVDDLNGDANPDLLVFLNEGSDPEIATVMAKAGKNGTILWEENVTGNDVDIDAFPVDDLNGDGVADVIVVIEERRADSVTETNVTIIAKVGKNGTHLWEEKENLAGYGEVQVVPVDDVDGDGKPDLIVSVWVASLTNDFWNGSVILKSGTNGTHLWNESINSTEEHFWLNAFPVDDVDGDGKPDIIVEMETEYWDDYEAKAITNNTVIVKSGINGTHLWEENNTGEYAKMWARTVDDVDGDGKPEIAVFTSEIDVGTNTSARNVSIIVKVGKNGTHLWQENFTGYDPDEYVGWYIIPMPDLNGDGLRDLIVGISGWIAQDEEDEDGDPRWNGTVIAKVGKNGTHLWQENHTATYWRSDLKLMTVGDLNGNGVPDVIVVLKYDRYNATVIAKEGKNGTHLWQENITAENGYGLQKVRVEPTDDLNCDSLPDVLVVVESGLDAWPYPAEDFVIAKVGKNGTHLWEERISGNSVGIDRVYPVGDFSCDNKTDVAVYTRDWFETINKNVLIIKEGKTGRHLVTLNSSAYLYLAGEYFLELYKDGDEVEDYTYDLNCDGISDLLVYTREHMYVIHKGTRGDSSDANGRKSDLFFTDEAVYAIGVGFVPLEWINISVVPDSNWTDGVPIPSDVSSDGVNTVQSDANGSVFALVWPQPLTVGAYDIVFDADQNGVYNEGTDAVDSASPGFVVQERPAVEAVPVLTTLGLGVLMLFMALVAVPGLTKKRSEKK